MREPNHPENRTSELFAVVSESTKKHISEKKQLQKAVQKGRVE